MNHPTTKHIKEKREQVAYQFELEAVRLGFVVERRRSNYRYIVTDQQQKKEYTALVLPSSFDFYEYRINLRKRRIDLLIVERHNAVVPIRVVSLSQVEDYPPLHVPVLTRSKAKRRNHEEKGLLLSKLILNFESAERELAMLDPRTRRRYRAEMREYLHARIGRPWAS
jgi:hypothetical protein